MFIDTHAHLGSPAFKEDVNDVIGRALKENVWMISPGYNYQSSKRAIDISKIHEEGVYAAVGLHPIYVKNYTVKIKHDPQYLEGESLEDFDYSKYKTLALSPKVMAIGECGLDYYWKPKTKAKLSAFKDRQKEVFAEHIKLARELSLPLLVHCRMAHDDLIDILKFQISSFNLRGAAHCFTGTWNQARKLLDMGFYLGFNGIIWKLDLKEIIKKSPLDKILIETDCPELTPPWLEGRNEPINVRYVAQEIAKIKNTDIKTVEEVTEDNARELFKI